MKKGITISVIVLALAAVAYYGFKYLQKKKAETDATKGSTDLIIAEDGEIVGVSQTVPLGTGPTITYNPSGPTVTHVPTGSLDLATGSGGSGVSDLEALSHTGVDAPYGMF